jgi:CRISPR-associated protein (TIGR03986 family)
MTIRAPYNFVPLSDKVYFPDWAGHISHDIPFSDGLSGTIKLEITTKTPIFVRNGHKPKDKDEKNDQFISFSNIDNNFFIPATSLKGMIRNVVEIISFSKMPVDEKKKYAIREWNNNFLSRDLDIKGKQTEIRAGWLYFEKGEFKIDDCGKPFRINHKRIDEMLKKAVFESNFKRRPQFKLTDEQKTAKFKYELFGALNSLKELPFKQDNQYSTERSQRVMVSAKTDAEFFGDIILTGQSGLWKEKDADKRNGQRDGKFYEFVVKREIEQTLSVPKTFFQQFEFIYKDSVDWLFWKKKLNAGERVPIFFRKNADKVIDFGLAFLYKLPYERSVGDVVHEHQGKSSEPDLAECLFGHIGKSDSLKSRVQFSHAFIKGNPKIEKNKEITTLGGPKASYYPNYIEQSGNNGIVNGNYKTYNDGVIRGWKRYPVHNSAIPRPTNNPNLDTEFIPLSTDNVFSGRIKFHNLKPLELGALLSALTFHGNTGYFHNVGMAKPLGYGKIEINAQLESTQDSEQKHFLALFEEQMNSFLNPESNTAWIKNKNIVELFSMARDISVEEENRLLGYMILEMQGRNEFTEAKTERRFLQSYSELTSQDTQISSPLADIYASREEEKRVAEEEKIRLLEEELKQQKIREAAETERRKAEAAQIGPLLTTSKDFKGIKNRLEEWLKKTNNSTLPVQFVDSVCSQILEVYKNLKPREQKEWAQFESNKIWTTLVAWVGEEKGKELFTKIIGIK